MLGKNHAFSSFSVNDKQKAEDFYEKTLGLNVSDMDEGFELNFANDNSVFVYSKQEHKPASFTVLNFPVDDLDEAMQELKEKGIHFETYDTPDMKTDENGIFTHGGMRMAWFKDPAGNVLAIIEE